MTIKIKPRPDCGGEICGFPDCECTENRRRWVDAADHAIWAVNEDGNDPETALGDLMACVLHWCDETGLDFDAAVARGRGHFEVEIGHA